MMNYPTPMSRIAEPPPEEKAVYSVRNNSALIATELRPLYRLIPISQISPSSHNPRRIFSPESLQELANSITDHGIIEPLIVRRRDLDNYEIVAGERRYRAAQLAGLFAVPAIVRDDIDDITHLRIALAENLQRENLNPIEEAEAYTQLNQLVGLKQTEIAVMVRKTQSTIAKSVALLKLPAHTQELIKTGSLSPAHGVILGRYRHLPELTDQIAILTVEMGATSKQLEEDNPPFITQLAMTAQIKAISYNTPFDRSNCEKCPHDAYRERNYSHYCLKPSCYDAKSAEVKAATQAQTELLIESSREEGAEMINIKDLKYSDFDRLYDSVLTPACRDCDTRCQALDSDNRIVEICLRPGHLGTLKAIETKASRKTARNDAQKAIESIIATIDGLDQLSTKDIVLLSYHALGNLRTLKTAAKVFARHGLTEALQEINNYKNTDGAKLTLLEKLDTVALVKVIVETLLQHEASQYADNSSDMYQSTGLAEINWYLPPAELGEPAS